MPPPTEQRPGETWELAPNRATYRVVAPLDRVERLRAAGLPLEFEALSIGTHSRQIAIVPLDESSEANAQLLASARDGLNASRRALAWMSDPDADPLEQFERVAAEYYRTTGYLRPGKSEPLESYRDSNDDENRKRFAEWCASRQREVLAELRAFVSKATGSVR